MKLTIDFSGFSQKLFIEDKPFFAQIYNGKEEPPEGFNAVVITLDASERSLLNWQKEIEKARSYKEQGLFILWEFNFSLDHASLDEELQFLSLQISVQHFTDTIWPEFHTMTLGVILYKGAIALTHKLALLDHLKWLSSLLPDETSCFIFLDTSSVDELPLYLKMISQDGYGHIQLFVKGPLFERYPFAAPAFAWDNPYSPLGYCSNQLEKRLEEKRISYALCLPSTEFEDRGQLHQLLEEFFPLRIISELFLEQEWDGIDKLLIFPQLLSERGWRKIRGFQAAGGEVIEILDGAAWPQLQ